jgi:hypothetical protein
LHRPSVAERHLDPPRSIDHVGVREDVTVWRDHNAAPSTLPKAATLSDRQAHDRRPDSVDGSYHGTGISIERVTLRN